MKYSKIAGAILCFNRPEYTKEVISSIEKADESNDIDWYVFQDGLINDISGKQYGTKEQISAVRDVIYSSTLPIKRFKRNKYNHSIALQKHKAHRLFKQYDLVYFFEDDLVIGKHYLRLLRIMAEQYPDAIGLMNVHPSSTSIGQLGHITRCPLPRLWGYYMNRQSFNKIKNEYATFVNEISKVDYNAKWQTPHVRDIVNYRWKCHDITVTRLCRQAGIQKYWPTVTRGRYIGKKGAIAYRNEKKFKNKGFERQPNIITYDEDATRKGFKLK